MHAPRQPDDPEVRGARHRLTAWVGLVAVIVAFVVASLAGWGMALVLYGVSSVTSALVAWFALRRLPPATREAFSMLVYGVMLLAVGDAVWTTLSFVQDEVSELSVADGPYLAGTALMVAGALRLGSRRLGARDVESLLDSLMLIAILLLVGWEIVAEPIVSAGGGSVAERVVLASYPIADTVLVAVSVRLVASGAARSITGMLILAAGSSLLVADIVYAVGIQEGWFGDGVELVANVLWLLAPLCVAIAALHPSIASTNDPRTAGGGLVPDGRIGRSRLAVSGLALLAMPMAAVVNAATGNTFDLRVLTLLGLVLAATVSVRLWRLTAHAERIRVELALQARTDSLTGLANRASLRNALDESRHHGDTHGLLYLDLDRFKIVNDSMGHGVGDELLVAVASRLRTITGGTDLVARVGGDEFAVVVRGREDDLAPGALDAIAGRIIDGLRNPVAVAGTEIVVGTSIGIAIADAGEDPTLTMRNADIALYAAKAGGGNRHVTFDDTMRSAAVDRLDLERDLRMGLDRGEVIPYFQPIVDLQSGELMGFEALARWRHPTRGLLGAPAFIPIAEETGSITRLGESMLFASCRAAVSWSRAIARPMSVSVNVSAVQLTDPGFVGIVRAALDATGLEAGRLVLELTETALVRDPDVATAMLEELVSLGVTIAIDDFGTGYSSLAHLRRFPITVLKVDRSLLDLPRQAEELPPIVRGVLDLAATLGLLTVAEGIETDAQRVCLLAGGCTYGQGYLYSAPLDPDAALAYTRARAGAAAAVTPPR